jgi:uncharacterized membrane protein
MLGVGTRLGAALTVASVLWAGAIFLVPLAAESAPALSATVFAVSSRICHQMPERSFHISGIQMPVCARCAGLYVTGALGALLGWMAISRLEARRRQLLLFAAAVPTAITWTLEFVGVMAFSNSARALAALPLGLAAGWVFVQMLRYDAQLDGVEVHSSRPRARSL